MIVLKTADIRSDLQKASELEMARQNKEYFDKLDRSLQQVADGRVVIKTMEELEDMAK
jgi:antitoxin YefM